MRPALLALALLALSSAPVQAQPAPPALTLEQIMADPDWIGAPIEQAWWSWDNQQVLYTSKRAGSPLRDVWSIAAAGGSARQLSDSELVGSDSVDPVYDPARQRAVFVRDGDVFLRDLRSGSLTALTRTPDEERGARFGSDGSVLWRLGNDWYRWRPGAVAASAIALPRAEVDPDAEEKLPYREHQLRLSSQLSREEAEDEAVRLQALARRRADPGRAAEPIYLGDGVEISDSSVSPDGRWLLLVTTAKDAEAGRVSTMPRYVTESGYEETEETRTRVGQNAPIAQALKLVDLRDGKVHELALDTLPGITSDPLAALRKAQKLPPFEGQRGVEVLGLEWRVEGEGLALQLRSIDNKDRWLATVDFANARLQPRHRLSDAAWINWNFNEFGWLRGDGGLWYVSEESGFSHLYTLALGGKPVQRTRGNWEVSSPQLTVDGQRMLFRCNRAWPGDYELCALDLASNAVVELTALDGVEAADAVDSRPEVTQLSGFALSPDGRQVLLRYSGKYLPAQAAVVALDDGKVRTLTDTRSAAYRAVAWMSPQHVQVPSRHGAGAIWGQLYRPAQLEPGRKYPIVLFVHGAGYTQNVHARYPYYFREQMFHNLLLQQGYLVLDLDYRASEGYGREWRTAIYRQMGHPELEDYLDGIEWLVAQHQGDAGNVGIYGGSYGGFMTFMALFREPERFHAGAALRPVTDWASYNHGYASNILNTPELDPEAYRKSSPIEYAAGLRGQLLISHGMIDDNVFYQDSVRLAQRLIELRKDGWELASFPLERHGYRHPESWHDQYRRILELFERTLKDD